MYNEERQFAYVENSLGLCNKKKIIKILTKII